MDNIIDLAWDDGIYKQKHDRLKLIKEQRRRHKDIESIEEYRNRQEKEEKLQQVRIIHKKRHRITPIKKMENERILKERLQTELIIRTNRKNEMIKLRYEGKSLQEIANIYKISRERVRQIIGIEGKGSKDKIIKEKLNCFSGNLNGKSYNYISNETGVSMVQIKRILRNTPKYPDGLRRCYSCKRILEVNKFYDNKSSNDGKCHTCIECTKQKMKNIEIDKKQNRKGQIYFEKHKCRKRTYCLIKRGIIKKTDCILKDETCKGRIEAHHYDGYNHPEKVRFYCVKHHKEIDGSLWGQRNYT